jgi:hypothetical protein
MWYQFPIPTDFENQKRIIRQLRRWIQKLEEDGVINGFAFNHYFMKNLNELRLRFDCTANSLEQIKKELGDNLKGLGVACALQESEWKDPEHVLKAYEFGSRCAFLFWELAEKGRFSEDYISNFLPVKERSNIPLAFQQCFNHGVMNSLGIPKLPNELMLHYIMTGESLGQIFELLLAVHIKS